AFKLTTPGLIAGKTVAEAEANANGRLFLENLRRDGKIIEFDENTVLELGDIVAVSGKHEALVEWAGRAQEVSDAELLNIPVEILDVYVSSAKANGQTLQDLAHRSSARGIYVTRIRRGSMGVDIPVRAHTKLYRGDIVSIRGTSKHVEEIIKEFGFADRP